MKALEFKFTNVENPIHGSVPSNACGLVNNDKLKVKVIENNLETIHEINIGNFAFNSYSGIMNVLANSGLRDYFQ